MSDFNRMEEMLSTLITMVGGMREDMNEMRGDINEMREDINELKVEQAKMRDDINELKVEQAKMREDINELKVEQAKIRTDNETKHKEIMNMLHVIKAEQDYVWDKTVHNERDIVKIREEVRLLKE